MKAQETFINESTTTTEYLINPFPGLRPFGFEESHLFFGREGQSDEVLLNLARHRFVAVLGASGGGKSSLMYCGLIPILYGGFMTNAGSEWTVITVRPGITPLENLAEAIIEKDENYNNATTEELEIGKSITNTIIRSSSMGLVDAIKQINVKSSSNIFILIDQFEELFRFIKTEGDAKAKSEAAAFVNLLIKSIQQSEVPVYVAMTMRSDFIGDCSQFPELTHIINKSHYLIPQMTREQMRLAIEGPVAVGGGQITNRLAHQLLNDIGNNPDQLPVLQHAMMRTWDYWTKHKKDNEPIDLRHYIAIGKISEALSQHANEAYSELSKREKEICEILFKCLTEKSSDNTGARKSARVKEIAHIAEASEQEVTNVIDCFRAPGRSLLMPSSDIVLHGNSLIEISHESLMRIWQRLKVWVEDEAESANMYRRLSEAAKMHQVGKTGLWRPPDLQLAINWMNKQKPTRVWAERYNQYYELAISFLENSRETYENEQRARELMQRRMLRRTRAVAVLLGVAAVISMLFFVFGWVQKMESEKQAELATQSAIEAEKQAKLARSAKARAEVEADKAREQKERAEAARKEAEKSEAYALEQKSFAELKEQEAFQQKEIAEYQKVEADIARVFALEQERIARIERDKADRLRMLSISQSMALKSLSVGSEDLQGLLAQQAYKFNEEYQGNSYDNFIYDGLYYALKGIEGEDFNRFKQHKDLVRAIAYEPDGTQYYTTGSDGKIYMWESFDNTAQLLYKHNYINYEMKVSKDGQFLVVAGEAPYVLVIDLLSFNYQKIYGHNGPVTELKFLHNKAMFLSYGTNDKTLRINDLENFQSTELKVFNHRVTAMAVSNDDELLISANEMGQLHFWNLDNIGETIKVIDITEQPIHAISFNHGGDLLAIGNEDGVVFLADMENGVEGFKILSGLLGQESRVSEIVFSNNNELLATASYDGSVQMWIMDHLNKLPLTFKDHNDYVWSISFNPSGNYLLTGSRDGSLKVWPTRATLMSDKLCERLGRNLTRREWDRYVGEDIDFRNTCK
ncbi:MAG TPA: hypothetical protein DDY13_13250 [Cytophagales bacterium]|jgi:energy-coupling factor transporter ATP-binding protein EcfA2|nr:hypothetical protein [Cytophagales bacterium]